MASIKQQCLSCGKGYTLPNQHSNYCSVGCAYDFNQKHKLLKDSKMINEVNVKFDNFESQKESPVLSNKCGIGIISFIILILVHNIAMFDYMHSFDSFSIAMLLFLIVSSCACGFMIANINNLNYRNHNIQ